jgi:hypothetical protein
MILRTRFLHVHILHAHVALMNRSRHADADYVTSERDAKRAWRADADYATSERDARKAQRADADQRYAPTKTGLRGLRTRCEDNAAYRRGLCNLRTRCQESAARRLEPKKMIQPDPSSCCVLLMSVRRRCQTPSEKSVGSEKLDRVKPLVLTS